MDSLPENSLEAFELDGEEQQKKFRELMEKNNILLHKVFVQNQDGADLLNKWRDSLMMIPTINADSTQFGAGIVEGEKTFIRNIITSIQSVESEL